MCEKASAAHFDELHARTQAGSQRATSVCACARKYPMTVRVGAHTCSVLGGQRPASKPPSVVSSTTVNFYYLRFSAWAFDFRSPEGGEFMRWLSL